MDLPNAQVRRATLDDLPQLQALWGKAGLPIPVLEKRFTEFQVLQSPEAGIVAAMGLQIENHQGYIHSEAYSDPAQRESMRPLIWQRLLGVARNHGLFRLWVTDSGTFWKGQGFTPADEETLPKLPPAFGAPGRTFVTLKLKDEVIPSISLDSEFKLFMESVKRESEEEYKKAKALKALATIIAVAFFLLVCTGGVYYLRYIKFQQNQDPQPAALPTPLPAPPPQSTNAAPPPKPAPVTTPTPPAPAQKQPN